MILCLNVLVYRLEFLTFKLNTSYLQVPIYDFLAVQ